VEQENAEADLDQTEEVLVEEVRTEEEVQVADLAQTEEEKAQDEAHHQQNVCIHL